MKLELDLHAGCPKRAVFAASLVALLSAMAPVPAMASNTNQCIVDLGGIAVCEDLNAAGLPSNLGACCDGLRAMAKDRCECNPAIDVMLGEGGDALYDLEAVCRSTQPFKWARVKPRASRSCGSLQSHDYGCGPNDMEIDAARLQTVLGFSALWENIGDEAMCFDVPLLVDHLEGLFTPDIKLTGPYGIGLYEGYQGVAEYLGVPFAGLNHGWWTDVPPADPYHGAMLETSIDGSTWTLGVNMGGNFARGLIDFEGVIAQDVSFPGCDTRVNDYKILPTEGLRDWVELITQSAEFSERWGAKDICRYHTAFCAGDPATRQYESEQECLDYIGSLPAYSEACGSQRPLSGLSVTCKLKHHFMIPANPALHCAHIGREGTHDPNHKMKCDDVAECSDPNEGSEWPTVRNIGPDTPQQIIDLWEANNVGSEDEPLGCASNLPGGLLFNPPTQCGFLWANEGLAPGESVESCNGLSKLVMQHDGNLVLYRRGTATWNTQTWGHSPAAAILQADGNFVVYDLEAKPLWNSETWNAPGAFLAVQDDGNLVIYSKDSKVLWSSDTWER